MMGRHLYPSKFVWVVVFNGFIFIGFIQSCKAKINAFAGTVQILIITILFILNPGILKRLSNSFYLSNPWAQRLQTLL
jgi:hypothetical protein